MVRIMPGRAIGAYLLVGLALAAGIAGMGLIFDAATGGSLVELAMGVPLLSAGLWWSSRQLKGSIAANRTYREGQRDGS
jgi:hypothetical protein